MQTRVLTRRRFLAPVIWSALVCGGAFGQQISIDFEAQCSHGQQSSGPCSSTFVQAGAAQTLTIPTSLGNVMVQGGVLLDRATNEPADESAIYATASTPNIPAPAGAQESITITFPSAVTNFDLMVLNGLPTTTAYTVSDNAGHSSSFTVPPNTSSGVQAIGFAVAGTVITISTTGPAWDFSIDNISFSPLPPNPVESAVPNILSFASQTNANAPLQQSIVVSNTGSGTLTYNASVISGSPWVTVTPGTGTAVLGIPSFVTVTVNPAGLTPGSYRDVVQISSGFGSSLIPVTLFVANPGPIIAANPIGVVFTEVQGAGSSLVQNVTIANTGSAGTTVNWNASAAKTSGVPNADFLTFSSITGQSTPGNPSTLGLSLNSGAASLAPGVYYELVELDDAQSQNQPQYVTAILNVLPSSSTGLPVVSPAGLVFTGTVGKPVLPQNFTVSGSSVPVQIFQAVALNPPGQNWLSVSPTQATASTAVPGFLKVSINTTGLAAGVYNGSIFLANYSGVGQGAGNIALGSVNITLVLASPSTSTGSAVSSEQTKPRPEVGVAGCAPAAVVLTESGIPNNFSLPAGWPASLVTTLTDDCGNALEGGTVTASFSNGDVPLSLADQGAGGQYIATWQPSNLANTVITLNGTSGTLKPGAALLAGVVNPNKNPVLNPNGVLNNFSYTVGGALAPGTLVAAFGSGLSNSGTPAQTTPPWPTQVQNTEVLLGGFLVPLYYVSTGQLDAQLPGPIRANQQYPAVGVVNGQLTLPVTLTITPNAPGVLWDTTDQSANCKIAEICSLIAQNASQNYALVSSSNPAHPGDVLVIYLLGMGATNPSVASGQVSPGPDTGLAQVATQPVVKVGGQTANVAFAGLAPGFVGLYQVDFTVPTVPAGTQNVTVTQGNAAANITTLAVAAP